MSFYESKYRKCKNRFTFFALYIVLNIQYIPQLKYNERNIHKRFTVISYEIKKKNLYFNIYRDISENVNLKHFKPKL